MKARAAAHFEVYVNPYFKKKNPDLKNEIRKGITLLSYDE